MKNLIQLASVVIALCLTGCAANSIKKTWRAPDYQGGPVKKLAVLAVDERGMVRKGFENRIVRELTERGQSARVTYDLVSLPEIKADKVAAKRALIEAGADSLLIVRLVDQTTYSRQVEASPEVFVPVTTGIDTLSGYGWYDYYTVAFVDMGASWGSTTQVIYLDTSLFDLAPGRRLWSTLTETTLKEGDDRLVEVDRLTAKVVAALGRDRMVR